MLDLRKTIESKNNNNKEYIFKDYKISNLEYNYEADMIVCFIKDDWGTYKAYFKGFKNGVPKFADDRFQAITFRNTSVGLKSFDKVVAYCELHKTESNNEENNMIDLREKKTSKKEDENEIKFVNKGDEFKSDKADTVKIVDIDKKDDKTEVTYKVGDDEKKGDIEDVLKMLNGAEYSKVEDKKDDDKKSDDKEDDKDKKKESVDDNSVEVILTEDFHVPGTDVILEKGDVIYIIPKKEEN